MPQHVVEEIQHRYSLIGRSPLTDITREQGRLVEEQLAAAGHSVPVYIGMRNWRPYIPEVVKQMRADGVEAAAVLCLAPQNSRTSVGLYKRAVQAEAGPIRIDFTESWASHPLLADAFAERLRAAQARLTDEDGAPVPVLFTAHSVPTRTIQPPSAAEASGHAFGRARAPIRMQTTLAAPPNWWPRAYRRFRDGGSRFRARAPAEVHGSGRLWRRRSIPSRPRA